MRPGPRRGTSLVEVLIATALFSLIAAGLTATYITNLTFARAQSYRTQAVTTATSILEQLRETGYTDLDAIYYTPTTPPPMTVRVLDPEATSSVPSFYRNLGIKINVRDTTTLSETWTVHNLSVEPSADAPKLPMRYWLILSKDASTSSDIRQVFQLALLYQWHVPTSSGDDWHSGSMRVVVPRQSPVGK